MSSPPAPLLISPVWRRGEQSKHSQALAPSLGRLGSVGGSGSPVARKTSVLPHTSVLNPCLHQGDMAFSWESSLLRISSIYIFTHVGADGKQGSELNVLGRCVCWFPWSWVLAVSLFALVTCGYSAGDSPGAGAALSPATPRDSLPVQRAWSRCEGCTCSCVLLGM